MTTRLGAIKTECTGFRFRSWLAARWAVIFVAIDARSEGV